LDEAPPQKSNLISRWQLPALPVTLLDRISALHATTSASGSSTLPPHLSIPFHSPSSPSRTNRKFTASEPGLRSVFGFGFDFAFCVSNDSTPLIPRNPTAGIDHSCFLLLLLNCDRRDCEHRTALGSPALWRSRSLSRSCLGLCPSQCRATPDYLISPWMFHNPNVNYSIPPIPDSLDSTLSVFAHFHVRSHVVHRQNQLGPSLRTPTQFSMTLFLSVPRGQIRI
jgi:hypothetical protein